MTRRNLDPVFTCVRNKAYGRDIVKAMNEAFKAEGIPFGLYFSTLDFSWVLKNKPIKNAMGSMLHDRRQGVTWYTRGRDSDTVYALFEEPWAYGQRKTVWLENVRTTEKSTVQVLGQKDVHVEHRYVPEKETATTWKQHEKALEISAVRCYRPYNTRDWHNPVIIKITNAE